jgi:hypothetical protein
MWIVQELCSARDCRVLCGTKITEAFYLVAVYYSSGLLYGNDNYAPILQQIQWSWRGQERPYHHLRDLIIHSRHQECQLKHDKIYALLGLLNNEFHEIAVDYESPLSELYVQVLRSLFVFDRASFRLPIKLHLLRKTLGIGEGGVSIESDMIVRCETENYLSCCERLEGAAKGSRLWYRHEEAWKVGAVNGQDFRRKLLAANRSGTREITWLGETIELEPLAKRIQYNWLDFQRSQLDVSWVLQHPPEQRVFLTQ